MCTQTCIPKNLKLFLCISLIVTANFFSWSQLNFSQTSSPEVYQGNTLLKLPFAGGLNLPQFSTIDIDYDGDEDVFIFDRSSDLPIIFKREQCGVSPCFVPLFNAHTLFPADLNYRVQLVDYNRDNKKDIFCYGIGGLKVFQNCGNAQQGIQWKLIKKLVYSDYEGLNLNLYVSSADIPAIEDIDNDNDLDILTFSLNGDHVEYHQNQSQELYGHSDSLVFKLKNRCWGKFREDLSSSTIFLNDNSAACTGSNVSSPQKVSGAAKHTGSTLLALDIDHSGVMDLIVGDISTPNLNLLINGGTQVNSNSAMSIIDPSFPSNTTPINVDYFPAAYFIDLDFDSKKDLVVSPNAKNLAMNTKSVHFFKNIGTVDLPVFSFQTNNLLQKDMIDVGSGSVPHLVDIDNDNDLDLFISNDHEYVPSNTKKSFITFYKNIGSATNPIFKLFDADLQNWSTAGFGNHFSISFGDINSDGFKDILLTKEDGSNYFMLNTTSSGPIPTFNNSQGVLIDGNQQPINKGAYSQTQLVNLDNDQDLDLVIGKKDGTIAYYENTGSTTSPIFSLITDKLGNVNVATNQVEGLARPFFTHLNGSLSLIVGKADGYLAYYTDILSNGSINNTFNLVTSKLDNLFFGASTSLTIGDLDQDQNIDLLAGNELGGIIHTEQNPTLSTEHLVLNSNLQIGISPNPTKNMVHIRVNDHQEVHCKVYNGLMQLIDEELFWDDSNLDLSEFAAGLYIIQFEHNHQIIQQEKILLLNE